MGKLVHDQQWFADGCVAAVSTGHQGSDNQLRMPGCYYLLI
jgi:hypothetical protein